MTKHRETERVLLPAGDSPLALPELEATCLAPLSHLLTRLARWESDATGSTWTIGDFRILIVETTVAPEAVLYVQFWSEPDQPISWEVSSGHHNRKARPFVSRQARRALADMGFRVGGAACNFGKAVTIANKGDAAVVARDVLRIFHDALGYRGRTALVAKTTASGRSDRAVVHSVLTGDDVVAMLGRFGYRAELQERKPRPVVFAEQGGFRFAVTTDIPDGYGAFRCLDLAAMVGRISNATTAAWVTALNQLNGRSRVARGWIDPDGNVLVGTSFCLRGGLTEAHLADQVGGWRKAAEELIGHPAPADDREASLPDEPEDRVRKALVH
jgi:hypothetical protein